MTPTPQTAEFNPRLNTEFKIGQTIMRPDGHNLTVQAVEEHFGNVQVRFYDNFAHKTEWEEITQLREILKGEKKP